MYNKVILQGNLTRDVEIRYTPGGTAVGNTGIAVNRRYKAANGEQREETLFIDLTLFGRTAEIAHQYLRKGRSVLVDGRLTLEQWTAQDGTKRSKHSVTVENLQMLGGRDEMGGAPADNGYGAAAQQGGYGAPSQPQGGGYAQSGGYDAPASSAPAQNAPAKQPGEPEIPEIDINEDEIPF
jgi:single-strand DNA-binding protein